MNEECTVYDLGNVNRKSGGPRPVVAPPTVPRRPDVVAPPAAASRWDDLRIVVLRLVDSLSLFFPGVAQTIRGELSVGLFFLSASGFLVALGWAVLATLDRLSGTLDVLGHPAEAAVWSLGLIYLLGVALYLGNVISASADRDRPPHPTVAGIASALLPGWGQFLNDDRLRSVLFLAGVWSVAAAWILISEPTQQVLESQGLFLPTAVRLACSPIARWTAAAVVWSLAIYDAVTSATTQRRL